MKKRAVHASRYSYPTHLRVLSALVILACFFLMVACSGGENTRSGGGLNTCLPGAVDCRDNGGGGNGGNNPGGGGGNGDGDDPDPGILDCPVDLDPNAPLTVTHMDPATGIPGDEVAIFGTGFRKPNQNLEVLFHNEYAFVVETADCGALVRVPPQPTGSASQVGVSVSLGSELGSVPDGFNYTGNVECSGLPRIDSLSVNEVEFGRTVTLFGAGFNPDIHAGVGSQEATVVSYNSETSITIRMPQELENDCLNVEGCIYRVAVQNPDGCHDIKHGAIRGRSHDTDNDGVPDRIEESHCGTSTILPDTDGDGLDDLLECVNSRGNLTNPLVCDPTKADSDGDGRDTDGDGTVDTALDHEEYHAYGTCMNLDHDGDGYLHYRGYGEDPNQIDWEANEVDCNDDAAGVNPGVSDDPLDGVDRDCRPPVARGEVMSCPLLEQGHAPTRRLNGAGIDACNGYNIHLYPNDQHRNELCFKIGATIPTGLGYWADQQIEYKIDATRFRLQTRPPQLTYEINYDGREPVAQCGPLDSDLRDSTCESEESAGGPPSCRRGTVELGSYDFLEEFPSDEPEACYLNEQIFSWDSDNGQRIPAGFRESYIRVATVPALPAPAGHQISLHRRLEVGYVFVSDRGVFQEYATGACDFGD